jgi:hypothetical protein
VLEGGALEGGESSGGVVTSGVLGSIVRSDSRARWTVWSAASRGGL